MVLVFSGLPLEHHSAILTTIHHHCWTLNYSDSVHPPLNTVPGIQIRNLKQELCDHLTLLHQRVELWWQPSAGDYLQILCRFLLTKNACHQTFGNKLHIFKMVLFFAELFRKDKGGKRLIKHMAADASKTDHSPYLAYFSIFCPINQNALAFKVGQYNQDTVTLESF